MASRNSLSDDWEDVGDDNLSVISFSTAEPDADVASTTSKSDDNSMPAELDAAQNETSLQRPATPTPESQPQTSSQPQAVEGDENNDISAQELPSSEQHNPFNDEVDEINQLLEESTFHSEVDPVLLRSTLESLRDILQDTSQSLRDMVIGLSDSARWKSLAICDLLSKQVAELLPISSGYAKVWSGSPRDLPIDPNLHGWLTGVRVKVLSLKAEIQAISRSSPDASPSNLVTIWHELEVYEKQMADFLPIIQVDFNEFQTQHMNIPIASTMSVNSSAQGGFRSLAIDRSDPIDIPQPNSGAPSPSYSGEFPRDPRNQVWLLRHELYRLKDLIKQTREKLSNKLGLSDSGSALASDISATYKKLHITLETALSNHGSDWIDSGLSGGLTYPEFLGLDADCIRDFSCQLRLTMNELPRDSKEAWASEWGTQLESLEILAMVLSATLTPNRD